MDHINPKPAYRQKRGFPLRPT